MAERFTKTLEDKYKWAVNLPLPHTKDGPLKMLMNRYLMKNLLLATGFITFALLMVVMLTQSLRILELVANSDAPPGIFFKLVALSLPKFLETILPVALVTAVLFVYNRFIIDNELIVLRSCGFDQHALARPALNLAAICGAIMLVLTVWATPVSYTQVKEMRLSVMSKYSSFLLREGVFNTFGKDLTVYLRNRDQNGDLIGLVIHDTRDKTKPPYTVTAKRGRLVMCDETPSIVVYDGMRQQLDLRSQTVSKLHFSQYMIEIKGFARGPGARARDYSERTLYELLHPDMNVKYDRDHRDAFMAEAHADIARPLTPVAFTLAVLAIVLLGPFNRRGQTKKILFAALVVAVLMAANLGLMSAARKKLELAPLLYIVNFVPIFLGYYALDFRGEQQIMRMLRKWRASRAQHGAEEEAA